MVRATSCQRKGLTPIPLPARMWEALLYHTSDKFSSNLSSRPIPSNSFIFDRHAKILGFFVWIYALCLSLPPLFGWGSYSPEAGNVSCSVSWEVHDPVTKSESYIGFLFILGLLVPVLVISGSYAAIILTLRRARKRAGKFLPKDREPQRHLSMLKLQFQRRTSVRWRNYRYFVNFIRLNVAFQ